MKQTQTATAVFMVEPTTFGFDEQTAVTNTFQHKTNTPQEALAKAAAKEFEAVVDVLRAHNIEVIIFRDTVAPPKPNAVFPNNWLSTWPDGRVYLYPMATASRRIERSKAALDMLGQSFKITEIIDISGKEQQGRFLESTGAIVFDHPNKIAYACVSPRCEEQLFTDHVQQLGYKPLPFHAFNKEGAPIYHTNVELAIQNTTAVVCLDAVTDPAERQLVIENLEKTNHTVIPISFAQVDAYCANVIEVQNKDGQAFLLLSQSAYDAFTPEQRRILAQDKTLLPVALPTIQKIGGGSARCMVAEIFLPRK